MNAMPEMFRKALKVEEHERKVPETVISEEELLALFKDLSPVEQDMLNNLYERAKVGGGDFPALLEQVRAAKIQVPSSEHRVNGTHYFSTFNTNRAVIVRIDGEGFLTVEDV